MATKKPKRTISVISDEIAVVNASLKAATEQVKSLGVEKERLEKELIAESEKLGLTAGGGGKSKFRINDEEIPVVSPESWGDFYACIKKNDWFHLLQRRPSVTGCRELWEKGIEIPGVSKFTKKRVTVTGV